LIDVVLLGGRGRIGSGLRMFLPQLDAGYRFTSVDLPGSPDMATQPVPQRDFVDLDIAAEPDRVRELMADRDVVVYLARTGGLQEMNAMSDLVFQALLDQQRVPMVVGTSSVHACDGAYSVDEPPWSIWAERRFDELDPRPERVSSLLDACPTNDYGREKAHVEDWCRRLAGLGHAAVAARWGGVNAENEMKSEKGYFALWCHQQDAARFVHACYTTHRKGSLRSGAHYAVVSNNTYNIFDIELARREIGYEPQHDAEIFYSGG
jgi:nucleoside-diphosphate-sugar epimerase